jgi:hypothetical protein
MANPEYLAYPASGLNCWGVDPVGGRLERMGYQVELQPMAQTG